MGPPISQSVGTDAEIPVYHLKRWVNSFESESKLHTNLSLRIILFLFITVEGYRPF